MMDIPHQSGKLWFKRKYAIRFRGEVRVDPSEPLNFFLTVSELDAISVSGAGTVEVPDWESESFSLNISGSGDIEMGKLVASEVELKISGVGRLTKVEE